MRRSIARVSALRQGLFYICMQKVRTHIVQNLAQQGERLGVGHCAQLEFRKHFHDGVAACLTTRRKKWRWRQRVASSRERRNGERKVLCLDSMMSARSETLVRTGRPACVSFLATTVIIVQQHVKTSRVGEPIDKVSKLCGRYGIGRTVPTVTIYKIRVNSAA